MEYHIIYSIGRDCASAMYLREARLRLASGPLDWLSNASFEQRINLLCERFESFLNLPDFRKLPVMQHARTDSACDNYENIRTGFHHYHDFEKGVPFHESFATAKARYERRIARFLDDLKSNKKVLLVWLSHEATNDDELLLKNCNRVIKEFGNHIDFLLIEHDENAPMDKVREYKLSENVTRISLYTKSKDELGRYTTKGREEYIAPIFGRFSISGIAEVRRTQKMKRLLGRFITIFVPIRKYRKIIRQALED